MRKKLQFMIAALAIGVCAFTLQAQQSLPTDGEYYVIKNYAFNTYVGGSGSGEGAVKNEDSETNTNYHVFLVTGNNTDGYTLTQQYTGNQIRYNALNKWSLFYATSGNNTLWILDNSSNNDYISFVRKGGSGGIGGDNASSNSTLYSDKGTSATLPNQWNFDASEAKTILLAQLSEVVNAVTIAPGVSATLDEAIATANHMSSGNTNAEIVAAIKNINTALSTAYKEGAEAKLPAAGGDYFIKVGGYFVNLYDGVISNAVSTVSLGALVENMSIADASQIFNIAKLSGVDHLTSIDRYAVFSRKDMNWHIGDNGRLRNDWGESDNNWRTVNFLYDGSKFAWQFAGQSASKGFLKMISETELANDGNTALDAGDFVFDIIPVASVYNDSSAYARQLLNENASNIGLGNGQYSQEVYSALETASVENSDASTTELLALGVALRNFVPNVSTSIGENSSMNNLKIHAVENGVQLSGSAHNIAVYSVAGQLVKQVQLNGEAKVVSLAKGFYIINGNKVIVN